MCRFKFVICGEKRYNRIRTSEEFVLFLKSDWYQNDLWKRICNDRSHPHLSVN